MRPRTELPVGHHGHFPAKVIEDDDSNSSGSRRGKCEVSGRIERVRVVLRQPVMRCKPLAARFIDIDGHRVKGKFVKKKPGPDAWQLANGRLDDNTDVRLCRLPLRRVVRIIFESRWLA